MWSVAIELRVFLSAVNQNSASAWLHVWHLFAHIHEQMCTGKLQYFQLTIYTFTASESNTLNLHFYSVALNTSHIALYCVCCHRRRFCTWPYWNSKRCFIIAISVVVSRKTWCNTQIHKIVQCALCLCFCIGTQAHNNECQCDACSNNHRLPWVRDIIKAQHILAGSFCL